MERLEWALARGMLTFVEAGERMTAAYSARFTARLAELTADLPGEPQADRREASPTLPIWSALGALLTVTATTLVALLVLVLSASVLTDLLSLIRP